MASISLIEILGFWLLVGPESHSVMPFDGDRNTGVSQEIVSMYAYPCVYKAHVCMYGSVSVLRPSLDL